MPLISSFYGILIRMYFFDVDQHHLPHIHAQYQGQHAQFAIGSGELLAGELPRAQTRMVQAWIEIHGDELAAAWQMAVNGFRPGGIAPLKLLARSPEMTSPSNPRVIRVEPQAGYRLLLDFENGETRLFDLTSYLDKGVFRSLRDGTEFSKAQVVDGAVEWPGEVDLSHDTLYVRSVVVHQATA